MAKSPAYMEEVRQLRALIDALGKSEAVTDKEIEIIKQRFEKLESAMEKHREQQSQTMLELALIRQRFDDHVKRLELWENRRWQLYLLFGGSVLSLAANLFLTLTRR